MLFSSPSFRLSNCSAFPARPTLSVFPLRGDIFRSVLMAIGAVSFGLLPFSTSLTSKREASGCIKFFQRQNLFGSPSKQNSLAKGLVWNTQFLRPFHQGLSLPVMFNINASPAISLLLSSSGPFAIFRGVAKAVFNSLNGQSLGSLSHIGKKVFKNFPSFAIINSPATIVRKKFIIGVSAPLLHRTPNPICWRICETVFNPAWKFLAAAADFSFLRQPHDLIYPCLTWSLLISFRFPQEHSKIE